MIRQDEPLQWKQGRTEQVARGGAKGFSPELLRVARRRAGVSQARLAAVVGVSATSVGGYERGTMTPGPRTLGLLADALHVTVEDLTVIDPGTAGLAQLRYQAGLTQAEVGAHLNLRPSSFPGIERAERGLTESQITILAKVFEVQPFEIQAAWDRTRAALGRHPHDQPGD